MGDRVPNTPANKHIFDDPRQGYDPVTRPYLFTVEHAYVFAPFYMYQKCYCGNPYNMTPASVDAAVKHLTKEFSTIRKLF